MKILVICQYYYPEPFMIPKICEELVKQGNDVTVVTGTPNYPMGEIYPGYENGKKMDEKLNGVNVHRCMTIPRKTGIINRFINYFSYPIESKKYIKRLEGDYDIIFINQLSPVMMAEAGIFYKKKHNKKIVLYCLDLWPESLCVGGIKKDSIIYKVFLRVSKRVYKNADKILVTSKSFCAYLNDLFDISYDKMLYLPQYAESQFLGVSEKRQENVFNLLFAGNIGVAQSVHTIIDAAKILINKNVVFHIVGDGIELDKMKKRAYGMKNVIFYGRKPMSDMPFYYQMADAMLVTLIDDPIISRTLPGKVQTYMAAGKPIIGAVNGETALVLDEAQGGFCGPSGDSEKLAENIIELMESGKASEIGEKCREYYLSTFSKEKFMSKLIDCFERVMRD